MFHFRHLLLNVAIGISVLVATTSAHAYGAHRLQGADPPNEPIIPAITGAFEAKVSARFDNLAGVGYAGWQAIFEVMVSFKHDTIYIGQRGYSSDIQAILYVGTQVYSVSLPNAITQGVEGTWYFGVQADGVLWIEDETGTNRVSAAAAVPANVVRSQTFIGEGLWNPPLDPLQGAVTGIQVRNLIDPRSFSHMDLLNLPGQIMGAFTVSFYARFDHVNTGSKVFCFTTDSDTTNSVSFGRSSSTFASSSTTASLVVQRGNASVSLDAHGSIVVGEMAFWHVTVDGFGNASIWKNGLVLFARRQYTPLIPDAVFRRNQYIGQGCSQLASEKLDGVVLGLRVDLHAAS